MYYINSIISFLILKNFITYRNSLMNILLLGEPFHSVPDMACIGLLPYFGKKYYLKDLSVENFKFNVTTYLCFPIPHWICQGIDVVFFSASPFCSRIPSDFIIL